MTLQELYQNKKLPSGWYYIQLGKYEPIIDCYDIDDDTWLCNSDKDIYPIVILSPVPKYTEYNKLKYKIEALEEDRDAWRDRYLEEIDR